MQKQKIIIIGGGIGGLMTAIALNKKGISAIIYEKERVFEGGAGLALWANATTILDKFGLLNELLQLGSPMDEMKLSTSTGKLLKTIKIKKLEDRFHSPSLIVLRKDLQNVLLNAVPSSQIHFNKHCIKAENKTDAVTVSFSDGTEVIADAVVFADGVHSYARKNIFNLPPLKYSGKTSWRGIAQFDKVQFEEKSSSEIFGIGKRVGVFPLPNGKVYWYGQVNMPEAEANKQSKTRDCVSSHFKNWSEPVSSLIKNTSDDNLILTKINYTDDIKRLVSGNIALLGDAAHPMTPDLGQGACQAIEDADVLAECLAKNDLIRDGFKDYERQRLKRVQIMARNSYRMGNIRQINNSVGFAIRNALFQFLPESFSLKMLERNIKR